MKHNAIFSTKLLLIALLALAGFLGSQKYQQVRQNRQIEAEKQKIIQQIDALEKKNQEISSSLKFFKSDGFKEQIARQQLNLKQPDEQVYSFKEKEEGQNSQAKAGVPEELSNPQKWVKYLAGKNF